MLPGNLEDGENEKKLLSFYKKLIANKNSIQKKSVSLTTVLTDIIRGKDTSSKKLGEERLANILRENFESLVSLGYGPEMKKTVLVSKIKTKIRQILMQKEATENMKNYTTMKNSYGCFFVNPPGARWRQSPR